jgi:hypothetical protein
MMPEAGPSCQWVRTLGASSDRSAGHGLEVRGDGCDAGGYGCRVMGDWTGMLGKRGAAPPLAMGDGNLLGAGREVHFTGFTPPMNVTRVLALTLLLPLAGRAAELAAVPTAPIAQKRELLFSDDFEGAVPAKPWHRVVPTFVVENGTLKGTQTRDRAVPAAEGKAAVTPHAAVHGLELPTRDSVVEVRIRFEGASMIDVEFDDRAYTGAHYGHLCRAQVRLNGVTLIDERDGTMRNDIYEMSKDPAKKAERTKLLAGRSVTYPAKLTAGQWYTLGVETVGDEMRVTLDGKPAGYLKSSGIGHPTKSKIEFGVAGKDGFFDDLKVWNAAPASRK